eukprot:TRINITY_DN2182_c0_g2_i2.p1 TRINITY_DN2182_c0_g2~~TRINITY_DN2182_c0_g2_i2.p1  ORF type:complete len:211 (+),score=34.23 TRINITY_DN2182_c0_g2_i2:89-721(+)
MSSVRIRHITTSFLSLLKSGTSTASSPRGSFSSANIDSLLILRRSDKVRTYQGLWAGVSGSVEEAADNNDPIRCSMREITEEISFKFPFRWSFVSSLEGVQLPEPPPIVQAQSTDIDESINIVRMNILRRGNSFEIEAPQYNTLWVVHPFLYDVSIASGPLSKSSYSAIRENVAFDWEHCETKWITPADFFNLPDDKLAPRLKQSLSNVI